MNMYKQLFATLFFAVLGTYCMAQNNTVAAGGNASGTNGSVSYTYGQVDYITATGASGTVSQGVQQPYEIYRVGIETGTVPVTLSLFPNPATEYVQLVAEQWSEYELEYHLYDVNGKLLEHKKVTSEQTLIPMGHLVPAVYMVHISSKGKPVDTYRIIKN